MEAKAAWQITYFDELDSTSTALKRCPDAAHGTVFVARQQTGGRGRLGRQFVSPEGGLYLSVLLRPNIPLDRLLHLTPMVAVAVRRAIHDVCGLWVQIKWINDLLWNEKKLCGILTEAVGEAVIVGIGINCSTEHFPPELQDIATSLKLVLGAAPDKDELLRALLWRLQEMDAALLLKRKDWLREYADACVTLGKTVQFVRGEQREIVFAEGIDENGALRVRDSGGKQLIVNSGEVSVRNVQKKD